VQFRSFAPVRFETLEVRGLESDGTLTTLIARVARSWDEFQQAQTTPIATEWILRVVLTGPTPLARELEDAEERQALSSELQRALGVLDVDVWTRGTHPPPLAGDHRGRQDVLGEALRLLEDVVSGRAELPGLQPEELAAPEAREDAASYVRKLLSGSEGDLLSRMLGPERGKA
jgi:hypothetical protein